MKSGDAKRPAPRLSVVASMYRSASYLREFHRRAGAAAQAFAPDDYEIVLVNDGSPDDSLDVALELRAADPRVRVVDLSKNFGHHQAMWTGLAHARGAWIFLIDCDLEESPEWLEKLAQTQRDTKADVVYGIQETRKGTAFTRLAGSLFYVLFNALSTVKIPKNLMTMRLMSRRYVDALLLHTESTFIIAGLWARTGFLQIGVPFPKSRKPSTTYNVLRRVSVLVDSITAFSETPLFIVFYLGVFLLVSSSIVAGYLVVRAILLGKMLDGWPSLMVSIWFFGGLCIFCQGIIGIYLARVFQETKRRPLTIVRQVHEAEGQPELAS